MRSFWLEGHCGEGGAGTANAERRGYRCGSNIPRRLVLPAIILLLDQEPSHGYALQQKLSGLGILDARVSPATIYRILSRLEEEGLAEHDHSDEGQGPTRKVYALTEEGKQALAEWRSHIRRTRELWIGSRRGFRADRRGSSGSEKDIRREARIHLHHR